MADKISPAGYVAGSQIYLRFLQRDDAPALLDFYRTNQEFLAPWEPARPAEFYTLEDQRQRVLARCSQLESERAYPFVMCLNTTDEIVGNINLNDVVRGTFLNANLGYAVSQTCNGRGVGSEAVSLMLKFAFGTLGLHRIQAATLLHNYGSMRVLEKNGFRREGLAVRYLKINNIWQDHNLFAITAEEFSGL